VRTGAIAGTVKDGVVEVPLVKPRVIVVRRLDDDPFRVHLEDVNVELSHQPGVLAKAVKSDEKGEATPPIVKGKVNHGIDTKHDPGQGEDQGGPLSERAHSSVAEPANRDPNIGLSKLAGDQHNNGGNQPTDGAEEKQKTAAAQRSFARVGQLARDQLVVLIISASKARLRVPVSLHEGALELYLGHKRDTSPLNGWSLSGYLGGELRKLFQVLNLLVGQVQILKIQQTDGAAADGVL
jgi:hypothetical protein